jgi:hypothetical protein
MNVKTRIIIFVATVFALSAASVNVFGQGAFFGAIYDTDETSIPVNKNIHTAKEDVYLNGGPQNMNAQGLPVGIYYFQVTDPSGATLLSTSPAVCRQVEVELTGSDQKGRIAGIWEGRPAFCDGPPILHPNGMTNPANGSTAVQLFPFLDTPNKGGEYKVWLIRQTDTTVIVGDPDTSPILSFNNNDAKTDNFKIDEDDDDDDDDQVYTLSGCKFYDADGDGIWDMGEVTIPGFRIAIIIDLDDPVIVTTGMDGCWEFENVPAESEYTIYEILPSGTWVQSYPAEVLVDIGNGPELIRAHQGFADDPACTDDVCEITDLDFGNYCEIIPGGQTLGYWSNRNGLAEIDAAEATQLNAYDLRNADGSHADFAFPADFNGKKPAFSQFLLSASATNMANMLSAQLAATYLSVANGYTDASVIVGVDGEGNPLNVNQLLVYANSLLANPIVAGTYMGQDGSVTIEASALRTEQERIKNILDHINNDGGFISPTPCPVVYDDPNCECSK